ncbi:hypothetical protein TRICHSKD4_4732 [Roseibium sp. TrichSKD4]|nr:hypothetical protein TRICHSKD4_4732 [Roseibium sp. TrichSKD4]
MALLMFAYFGSAAILFSLSLWEMVTNQRFDLRDYAACAVCSLVGPLALVLGALFLFKIRTLGHLSRAR